MEKNRKIKNNQHSENDSCWPGKTPYITPVGYFDELPERINRRIQSTGEASQPVRMVLLRPVLTAAISLVILVFGFQLYLNLSQIQKPDDEFLSFLKYYIDFDESEEAEIASAYYYALIDPETNLPITFDKYADDEWLSAIAEEVEWEIYDYP